MKSKTITLLSAAAVSLAITTPALADNQPSADVMAADVVILRPALLASTVAGSVVFLVSLPATAISKTVKTSAHALVVTPAKATFARPLGDFDYPKSQSEMAKAGGASY